MEITPQEMKNFLNHLVFSSAKSEKELGYQDPFVTSQQKKRDEKVTELLSEYVTFYKKKVNHSTICRYLILIPCMVIILCFAALLGYFALRLLNTETAVPVTDLIAFVTACISFISLIIGLLTIITKYFFPENDEQYITTIVEAIQRNDLENKRENAKHQHKPQNQDSGKADDQEE